MQKIGFLLALQLFCSAYSWDMTDQSKIDFLQAPSPLKIFWWNTACGNVNSKLKEAGKASPLYTNIEELAQAENNPDVLIIGETCPGNIPQQTQSALKKKYKYNYNLVKTNPHQKVRNGIWVFAKWNISEVHKETLDVDISKAANQKTARTYLLLKISSLDGEFFLSPVHFYNPWGKMALSTLMAQATGTNNVNYWQAEKHLELLKEDVDLDKDLVVVLGDFNSGRAVYGIPGLDMGAHRLFTVSGLTYIGPPENENTYASSSSKAVIKSNMPDVLIDQVFTSGFTKTKTIMLPLTGSDHYPILFQLEL